MVTGAARLATIEAMRPVLACLLVLVACGPADRQVEEPVGGVVAADGADRADAPPPPPAPADDPRLAALRTMTDLLTALADEIQHITEDQAPSKARCARLADAVETWGAEHYETYELADGEGTYLGITEADADNTPLRELARKLAWTSSLLVDLVDQDCLYGSGAYGEILYEYLVAYQGLAHWVHEGETAHWDYELLLAEAEAEM